MSTKEFHISTGKELLAIRHRVRNLVTHWAEDGRHKEVVLKSVLKRFLPETLGIGSGFVVKPTQDREVHESSSQIDLMIYDKNYPLLFKEGDFVVITADAVAAIIEVKSNMIGQGVTDIVNNATRQGKFIFDGWNQSPEAQYPYLFNGIFSFDGPNNPDIPTAGTNIRHGGADLTIDPNFNRFRVNHICFCNRFFFKYFSENPILGDGIYDLQELAFSYFISNLMDFIASRSVSPNSHMWFPIDKSFNKIWPNVM